MSNVQKLIAAVVGVIVVGFLIVGTSGQDEEDKLNEAFLRNAAMLFKIANTQCPKALKKHTGVSMVPPTESESDKKTFVKLTWIKKSGPFKKATCLIVENQNSVKELVVDGKTVLKDGLPVASD